MQRGHPSWLTDTRVGAQAFDFRTPTEVHRHALTAYVAKHRIRVAWVFDLQPSNPICRLFRRLGMERIVSYWGASISPIVPAWKLALRRLELAMRRSGPDFYVFESESMRELGVLGRGIAPDRTTVVPTGVDANCFAPDAAPPGYAHAALGIPGGRWLLCYSGHMEERKGVRMLIRAMRLIVERGEGADIHLVILGNKDDEARAFDNEFTPAMTSRITFGGYRKDLPEIFASAQAGVVASTGWDSWPMSIVEMASSGLPLIVSRLQGLREFVVDGTNGYSVPPADPEALANAILRLRADPEQCRAFAQHNRAKVLRRYTVEVQRQHLADIMATQFSQVSHQPSA